MRAESVDDDEDSEEARNDFARQARWDTEIQDVVGQRAKSRVFCLNSASEMGSWHTEQLGEELMPREFDFLRWEDVNSSEIEGINLCLCQRLRDGKAAYRQ